MEKKIDKRKIDVIKEHRTIEATKKLFMGFSGKICCIARNLGDTIWEEGSLHYEVTYLEDFYGEAPEIRTADLDTATHPIGWIFSGLSRGLNLEIKYLDYHRELSVRYNGEIVYLEVNNDLEGYNPFDEWEDKIEVLYKQAKKLEKATIEAQNIKEKEQVTRKNHEILQELKKKWGL